MSGWDLFVSMKKPRQSLAEWTDDAPICHQLPFSCYMEEVEVVIGVVAAVAVVIAGVVLLARRQPTDSVKGYRQTLSTLEHLQDRPPHDRTRSPEGSGTEPPWGPARPVRPVPSGRRAQRSLAVMNHEPRRMGGPALVLVVLAAVVGAIVYVGVRGHHTTPSASKKTDTTGTSHHHRPAPTTTTTTTQPARYKAVSTTTTSATYAPTTTTYTLTVGATSGSCWMSVTESNGTTVLAETLTPGTTHSLSVSGKTTILIGAPSVATIKIDAVPAVLPAGALAPFTVTLVPG